MEINFQLERNPIACSRTKKKNCLFLFLFFSVLKTLTPFKDLQHQEYIIHFHWILWSVWRRLAYTDIQCNGGKWESTNSKKIYYTLNCLITHLQCSYRIALKIYDSSYILIVEVVWVWSLLYCKNELCSDEIVEMERGEQDREWERFCGTMAIWWMAPQITLFYIHLFC